MPSILRMIVVFSMLLASGCRTASDTGRVVGSEDAPAPSALVLTDDAPRADPAAGELHALPAMPPEGFTYVAAMYAGPYPAFHPTFGGSVTMTNDAGDEIELSTRWPNRPSPENVDEDGQEPPPPVDIAGKAVRIWDAPRWMISWKVSAGTTAWLVHSASGDLEMPAEFLGLIEAVELISEEDWLQATAGLPVS